MLIPCCDLHGQIIAHAVIDDDMAHLADNRWFFSQYVGRKVGRRTLLLHRSVMGITFGDPRLVDHRDRDVLNNQRHNLRVATRSENAQNRSAIKKDGLPRGVTPKSKNGRTLWCARATLDYRTHHIGYFDDLADADAAAKAWRAEHMPFADESRGTT